MNETWQTPSAAAAELGIDRHAILGWIRSGELPAVDVSRKPGGRPRWRIDPAELESFLLRRQAGPPAHRIRKRKQSRRPGFIEYF